MIRGRSAVLGGSLVRSSTAGWGLLPTGPAALTWSCPSLVCDGRILASNHGNEAAVPHNCCRHARQPVASWTSVPRLGDARLAADSARPSEPEPTWSPETSAPCRNGGRHASTQSWGCVGVRRHHGPGRVTSTYRPWPLAA